MNPGDIKLPRPQAVKETTHCLEDFLLLVNLNFPQQQLRRKLLVSYESRYWDNKLSSSSKFDHHGTDSSSRHCSRIVRKTDLRIKSTLSYCGF